jgi:hypothetical protein
MRRPGSGRDELRSWGRSAFSGLATTLTTHPAASRGRNRDGSGPSINPSRQDGTTCDNPVRQGCENYPFEGGKAVADEGVCTPACTRDPSIGVLEDRPTRRPSAFVDPRTKASIFFCCPGGTLWERIWDNSIVKHAQHERFAP